MRARETERRHFAEVPKLGEAGITASSCHCAHYFNICRLKWRLSPLLAFTRAGSYSSRGSSKMLLHQRVAEAAAAQAALVEIQLLLH